MSTYKDELKRLEDGFAKTNLTRSDLSGYCERALEIVTELEQDVSRYKTEMEEVEALNGKQAVLIKEFRAEIERLNAMLHDAPTESPKRSWCDEVEKLEKDKETLTLCVKALAKALGLVVQALAETTGEQERGEP